MINNFGPSSTYIAEWIFWTTTGKTTNYNIYTSQETTIIPTTEHVIPIERDLEDVYPKFDPFTNVKARHMVAMNTSNEDRESSISFFLGKVVVLKNVSLTLDL